MKSHVERTLSKLKDFNFLIQKVEYFNAHGGVRVDLFGIIDLLAVHPSYGTLGIQVCGTDWSPHIKKITEDRREALLLWLASGNRFILVGWRKLKTGWAPRVREFTVAEDFPEITPDLLARLQASKCKNFEKDPLTMIL